MNRPPRIAVTLGDPRGIGPEIALRALAEPVGAEVVVVGAAEQVALLPQCQCLEVGSWREGAGQPVGMPPGEAHARAARAGGIAGRSIERAVDLALRGEVDAIVTAPIEKHALHLAGFPWPGHTEWLAHLSGDPAFIGAFERGGDVHRETAAIIFEVPVDQVTPDMRARAKTINFATIYGQGPFALSRQLGITQDQAKDFIRRYFERFAGIRTFLDASIEQARQRGYAETIQGRRRYIPELKDPTFNIRSFGERTAMNSPLQGSAADLIKLAMIAVAAALKSGGYTAGMILQIHDELIVETPVAEVDAVSGIVRRCMEGAASLRVPLVVDVGVGANWLDAKH